MKIRRHLSKLLLLGAAFIVAITLSACGSNSGSGFKKDLVQSDQLTIGLEGTYAPYSYRKDGKLTGFEVELGKAMAKKMGVKAKFVPTKWDSLVAGLGSGKYDVVLNNITVTPERKKSYIFSNPYIYSKYVLVTRAGTNVKDIKDIKGKKFAEGTGTNNEQVAKKYGAQIVPSGEFVNSVNLVKQKRVYGTINSVDSWNSYSSEQPTIGLNARQLTNDEAEPAQISAMFNKKDTKLQKEANKALNALRKNGQLKKISMKYFNKDITEK
ncbi:transporter substrate-binding domain-containing protein [Lentilactobacillus sp. Marseille-Q4993]|uniref:transporter substrate-binding domain-containing protein n=1 Tax=Lentilactobacillus sp. Marseille-Q4993 TaxID=3039492 RepID=UPI0024BCE2FC|nr:transporter substrate-binding domain-containing protein [Lentilactobacillus sp. Marseille-Q4993]